MNTIYLEKLYAKSKKKIVIAEKFGFLKLDIVNANLICKALSDNLNLWIKTNKRNVDSLFKPVILISLIEFFETNYITANKKPPKIGDKYQKGSKRYEVVDIGLYIEKNEAVKLECTNRGKNTLHQIILDCLYDDYTKLDDNSGSSNRNTFKPMIDFVNQAIGIKHNFHSFDNKFAVVCSKRHFENSFTLEERKIFPYEYITKNEKAEPNLPLTDFMFYIAPDYETIQDFVIDNDIKLDLVIFFDNKEDLQIQQDINRKSVKQVIFIGNQNPNVNSILKWNWTLPELQYFDKENEKTDEIIINPILVKNEALDNATCTFINYIKNVENKYGVNFGSVCQYISYLYPIIIPSENSRLSNKLEVINHSFKNKLKQVLTQELSGIGVDYSKMYDELLTIYNNALLQVEFTNNTKTKKLRSLKETKYLLIPSGQTLNIWKIEIKKVNWQKVKIISFSEFKKLTEKSDVTVLALEDKALFDEVYGGIHNIQWLLYDNEYKHYKKFITKYDNELLEEFKSKDRKKLSDINYPDELKIETTESLIDRIFDKDISDIDKEYELNHYDAICKEIIFDDNTSVKLSANSSVILINENNNPVNNKVGDLIIGDKIRIYENQHKDVLLKSIFQADKNGNFKKILKDSEKWKNILKSYCNNSDTKIQYVALKFGINPDTVRGWFKLNLDTKFPQNFKKLKDLMNKKDFKMSNDEYSQIYKSSRNYKSITIAVGRDLSDEIATFIINGNKGKLLSKLDDNIIISISEKNMPIRKIKSIKIEVN
jgi:hypothetical protein